MFGGALYSGNPRGNLSTSFPEISEKIVSNSARRMRAPSAPPRKIIILGGGVVLFEIRLVKDIVLSFDGRMRCDAGIMITFLGSGTRGDIFLMP